MLHMERDRYVDVASNQPEAHGPKGERARVLAERAGRGFGKKAAGAVLDEAATTPKRHPHQGRGNRAQQASKLWRRRFEWPTRAYAGALVEKRQKRARVDCPHAIQRHAQVPHPRYGSAVPYFTSWVEPLTEPHPCVAVQ